MSGLWRNLSGAFVDVSWGVLLFVLVVLCILFATGVEARFIYTDF
ncbi:hypothetical protein [Syntrophothermus lipocalidus]|uniref:Uncharacterized protein n=1 Tax=Syntrophothermus lipocalidus (strain DSM 12680 / TGB-C1) TaxID=643648 RepID=D7CJ63_SYNLT|nr:hypothetical protein [Syntrophothermus lipocalidus]ADI00952.1 hypothetical protein Slip_0152 [Syntrophothermus lipocalidus DSM 12680]